MSYFKVNKSLRDLSTSMHVDNFGYYKVIYKQTNSSKIVIMKNGMYVLFLKIFCPKKYLYLIIFLI